MRGGEIKKKKRCRETGKGICKEETDTVRQEDNQELWLWKGQQQKNSYICPKDAIFNFL